MRIGGTTIQYYFTCRRELWLYLNHIDPNQEDENVTVGKIINERSHKRKGTKEISIGNAKVDIVTGGRNPKLIEVKKSSKLLEPTIRQLQYYIYLLEKQNIFIDAEISIPKERKKLEITLDPEARRMLEQALKEIPEIATRESIPVYHHKPYCKGCAYREFCEV